jgi:hypothetical protein
MNPYIRDDEIEEHDKGHYIRIFIYGLYYWLLFNTARGFRLYPSLLSPTLS